MQGLGTVQEKFKVQVKVRYKGKKESVTKTFVLTQDDAKRLQAGAARGISLSGGGGPPESAGSGKVLQQQVTEGQTLKLLLQDPNHDNDKLDIQEAFDARASGTSQYTEQQDGLPSLYKFKINMSDLMEQVAKNNPYAGRNPD